jgi:signal transduction histidine kinase
MNNQVLLSSTLFNNLLLLILAGIGVFVVISIYIHILIRNKYISQLIKKNEELELYNNKLLESEKMLKQSNATKDKLFSIIAHDLRNPFNALVGLSEIIYNNIESFDTEKLKKYILIINTNSRSLHGQMENLLEWAKAQSNSIKFTPEEIRIHPIIYNVLTVFEVNAFSKNINLVNKVDETLEVYADKNIISTVCQNLIGNAIKFTKEGGKVIVSSKKINNFVEISITDTGIGISKSDLQLLFKTDNNFTRRGTNDEKGSGLGLLICKDFIEKNGGKIGISSTLGKGSTLKFTLPVNSTLKPTIHENLTKKNLFINSFNIFT